MRKRVMSMALVFATLIASGAPVYAGWDTDYKNTKYGRLEADLSCHMGWESTVGIATTTIEEEVYKVVSKVELQNNDNGKRLDSDTNIERHSKKSVAEAETRTRDYEIVTFGTHEVRDDRSYAVYTKTSDSVVI